MPGSQNKQSRRVQLFAVAAVLLITAAGTACTRVEPNAYQKALEIYYRNQLGGPDKSRMQQVIAELDEDLRKSPTDSSLLALHAESYLQLIRLGIESANVTDVEVRQLLHDLRLMQEMLDQPRSDAPPWLGPRIYSTVGDVLLLTAESFRQGEPQQNVPIYVLKTGMYQLALDFYLIAGQLAKEAGAGLRDDKDREALHGPMVKREMTNALDGYVNALSGLAASEQFLGLQEKAHSDFMAANSLLNGAPFPPEKTEDNHVAKSLYPGPHQLRADLASFLQTDSLVDYLERAKFSQVALRARIASVLMAGNLSGANAVDLNKEIAVVSSYLSSETVRATLTVEGAGDLEKEKVTIRLKPRALYGNQNVLPNLPFLQVSVGDQRHSVRLADSTSDTGEPAFPIVPATGLSISICSRSGASSVELVDNAQYFLGRSSPLLKKGDELRIIGPAGNVIGSWSVP